MLAYKADPLALLCRSAWRSTLGSAGAKEQQPTGLLNKGAMEQHRPLPGESCTTSGLASSRANDIRADPEISQKSSSQSRWRSPPCRELSVMSTLPACQASTE